MQSSLARAATVIAVLDRGDVMCPLANRRLTTTVAGVVAGLMIVLTVLRLRRSIG